MPETGRIRATNCLGARVAQSRSMPGVNGTHQMRHFPGHTCDTRGAKYHARCYQDCIAHELLADMYRGNSHGKSESLVYVSALVLKDVSQGRQFSRNGTAEISK